MNYHPNTYAAALSTRKDPNKMHDVPLAVLRQLLVANTTQLYPISDVVRGIKEGGEQLGYRIEVFDLTDPSKKTHSFGCYAIGVFEVFFVRARPSAS